MQDYGLSEEQALETPLTIDDPETGKKFTLGGYIELIEQAQKQTLRRGPEAMTPQEAGQPRLQTDTLVSPDIMRHVTKGGTRYSTVDPETGRLLLLPEPPGKTVVSDTRVLAKDIAAFMSEQNEEQRRELLPELRPILESAAPQIVEQLDDRGYGSLTDKQK